MSHGIITTETGNLAYGWVTYDDRPHGEGDCPVPNAGPDSPETWNCPNCSKFWTSLAATNVGTIQWTG